MKTLFIAFALLISTESFAQFQVFCGPTTQSMQYRNEKAPFLFFANDLPKNINTTSRMIFKIRGQEIEKNRYQLTHRDENSFRVVTSAIAPWISKLLPSAKYTQLDFDLSSCMFDDRASLKVAVLDTSKKLIHVGFGVKAISTYICECDFD
jgi:hypothetical protein